jgi:large subunit ribosomal protein L6
MSRVGKKPVAVPAGVKVAVADGKINVEGPKGKLSFAHRPEIGVKLGEGSKSVLVERPNDERTSKAYQGLTRALIQNMMVGVTQGYEKKLEIVGVGYLAAIKGNKLQLRVGFANEVELEIPKEIKVTCPDQTHVVVTGADKQAVGEFAAKVRLVRKPEPYKGKGVRYQGEHVKIKPGKAAAK